MHLHAPAACPGSVLRCPLAAGYDVTMPLISDYLMRVVLLVGATRGSQTSSYENKA